MRSSCFPHVLHGMPRYETENLKGRTSTCHTKCDAGERFPRGGKKSKKDKKYKVRWSEGLLVVTCPHRFIYMLCLLTEPESVRDMVTALYTRIPRERLPKAFIFDNACHMKQYIEKRFPVYFKDVLFVTDIFHHGKGDYTIHNCGDHIRIDEDHALFSVVNSSAVESINAWLRRLELSLRHMALHRFMHTAESICDIWNEDLRSKLLAKGLNSAADMQNMYFNALGLA